MMVLLKIHNCIRQTTFVVEGKNKMVKRLRPLFRYGGVNPVSPETVHVASAVFAREGSW